MWNIFCHKRALKTKFATRLFLKIYVQLQAFQKLISSQELEKIDLFWGYWNLVSVVHYSNPIVTGLHITLSTYITFEQSHISSRQGEMVKEIGLRDKDKGYN